MAEWCRGVADSSIQPVAFSLQLLLVPGRLCRRPPHPHPTLSSDPLPSFPHQHCLCSVPIPSATPPPGQLPVSPDLLVLSAEDSPCKLTRHHSKPVAPTAPRGKLTASPKSQCGGTTSRTHVADQQMKRRPWMGDDTWAAAAAGPCQTRGAQKHRPAAAGADALPPSPAGGAPAGAGQG